VGAGGEAPRSFFRQLGSIGVMGMSIPEKFGGAGVDYFRYSVILQEEASRALVTMGTVRTQLATSAATSPRSG